MCGISAISGANSVAGLAIDMVLDAIAHRGPDDRGSFLSVAGDCLLGHVRLSILDLSSAGHQPMTDATGRFVITYNGEVYNYLDIQRDLMLRHGPIAWKSGTDTEVIVEGFAREGLSFLGSLNGIFALAIYDTQERLLHILRDPLGIKPLFVTHQLQGVWFCSELKGLLALPNLKRTLRLESLADQLAFMYVPEPNTLYHEFHQVEPGVCFTYRAGQQIDAQTLFAHLHEPMDLSSEDEAVERLRAAFAAAVQRQLIADVPVSLFLSGGLDSSAVAQHAVQGGARVKSAYTIAISDADRKLDAQSDDLHYARLMAKRLGLDLRVIPAKQDFIALLPELIRYMEDGFTDPAAINTYLISASARQDGIKVMLSGQGADEYLGGYRRYQAEKLLYRLPAPLRTLLATLARFASPRLSRAFNVPGRRLTRLADLANQPLPKRWLAMYTWTSPQDIDDLLVTPGTRTDMEAFTELFDTFSDNDIIDAMMKVNQRYDLLSLNLCYTDRMSMAVGVEARVPFLDFDLVRLMNAISVGLKLKGWQGKYVLKKAMEPYLPKEVIYREKAGFSLPLRAWLQNENEMVNGYLNEDRLKRQGLFQPVAVWRIINEQTKGIADHANTLFTLLCQQIWLEENKIN